MPVECFLVVRRKLGFSMYTQGVVPSDAELFCCLRGDILGPKMKSVRMLGVFFTDCMNHSLPSCSDKFLTLKFLNSQVFHCIFPWSSLPLEPVGKYKAQRGDFE
jgi:hypothetical protein